MFPGDEMNVIHVTNNFHQALPQNNKCEPAKGDKKDQDITTLHGMIVVQKDKSVSFQRVLVLVGMQVVLVVALANQNASVLSVEVKTIW